MNGQYSQERSSIHLEGKLLPTLVARETPKENIARTLVLFPAPRTLIPGEMGPLDVLGEGCQR